MPHMGALLNGDIGHAYNIFKLAAGLKEGNISACIGMIETSTNGWGQPCMPMHSTDTPWFS